MPRGARHCRPPQEMPPVPTAHVAQHGDRRHGGNREPGDAGLPAGHHDVRGEQGPSAEPVLPPDLKQRLRQAVPPARSDPRHPRGLRVENRQPHAHEGGGDQDQRKASGHCQQEQAHEREAHADCERIRPRVPVRVQADERLEQGRGQLESERDQADLREAEVERRLEDRVDGRDQRLDQVIE